MAKRNKLSTDNHVGMLLKSVGIYGDELPNLAQRAALAFGNIRIAMGEDLADFDRSVRKIPDHSSSLKALRAERAARGL